MPSAFSCFFIGPGGVGLVSIPIALSGKRMSILGLSLGSWSTLFLISLSVVLVAVGLPFLYAGARRQVVLELDATGIGVWQLGRVHYTSWQDVASLTSVTVYGVDVLELRRESGRTLRIASRPVRHDMQEIWTRIEAWVVAERPDDWQRVVARVRMRGSRAGD